MAKGQIFEYAVLYHHKARKVNDEMQQAASELLVDVTRVVSTDDKTVAILAARNIPEAYLDKLDQVEIVIRPF